ncbi:MAG: hypothetical protein SCH70_02205 [Candidatus Methanoperedens sp.]|nr:hypothetical protein [Candidatus Methanoperedens sp.]
MMKPDKLFILVGVFLIVITAGCLSYQPAGDWKDTAPSISYDYKLNDMGIQTSAVDVEALNGGTATVYEDRKIISTANLRMEVDSVRTAFMGVRLRNFIDLLLMFLYKSNSLHIPN